MTLTAAGAAANDGGIGDTSAVNEGADIIARFNLIENAINAMQTRNAATVCQ